MCGITGGQLVLLGGLLCFWTMSPDVPCWVTPPSDLLSPPLGLCGRRRVVSDSLIATKQHLDVKKVERGTAGAHLLFPPPAPGTFYLGVTGLTQSSPSLPDSCCTVNPNKLILCPVAGGGDPSGGPQPTWTLGVETWRVFFGG